MRLADEATTTAAIELVTNAVRLHGSSRIARVIGRPEATLRSWTHADLTLRKKPSAEACAEILQKLGEGAEQIGPEHVPDRTAIGSALAEARANYASARTARDAIQVDRLATHRDKISAIGACTSALEQLNRFETVDEAKIIAMPAFVRVHDAIIEALRPFPEACASVLEALQKIESEDPQ